MSDGSLSQDEIDALLQGTSSMDFDEPSSSAMDSLDNGQLNAFASIMNSTVENQASNLAMLLSKGVTIGIPQVEQVNASMLAEGMSYDLVQVKMDFRQGLAGEHGYVIPTEVALAIVGPMTGLEGGELDDAAVNALGEAMSNVCGPVSTALGEKLNKTLMADPPQGMITNVTDLDAPSGNVIRISYTFTVDGQEIGAFLEYYTIPFVKAVLGGAAPKAGGAPANPALGNQAMPQMGNPMQGGMPGYGMPMQGGMPGYGMPMQGGMPGYGMPMQGMPPQHIQAVQYPNLGQMPMGGMEQGNISLLMDVYMEVTVELGRTKRLIKDILSMGEGTIIELDKLAGEPVDILVNHKLIAKGEVVVIDENFGVRVTEIVSPGERVNNMS